MSENLKRWNKFRNVPPEAKKDIKGGRMKGMTDINPVWRMHVLTEAYGPCGIGWYYTVDKKELVDGTNGEIAAFVDITLYVKDGEEWSKGIPGTGGNMFIAKETSGLRTSDEAYKMALTDALSVACKALGIGADVYWNEGTKYSQGEELADEVRKAIEPEVKKLIALAARKGQNEETLRLAAIKSYKVNNLYSLSKKDIEALSKRLETLPDKLTVDFSGTPLEEEE